MCPIVGKKRRRETKRKKGAICTEWASRGEREEDARTFIATLLGPTGQ